MTWTWAEFWARVAISVLLTPVVMLVGSIFGAEIVWWVAAIIALVFVFVGELLVDSFTGDA